MPMVVVVVVRKKIKLAFQIDNFGSSVQNGLDVQQDV